jgi:transcriptional regulator with XRE-family HTH domain
MQTMERDPASVAKKVKFIRKLRQWTQENLADAAGLTTRTIEKVESGRHRPEEQTLRSIARAVKMTDVQYFNDDEPTSEEEALAEVERLIRKMVLVPTNPIRTTADFLAAFGKPQAFRSDTSQVQNDKALEVAASLVDLIKDLIDGWNDLSATDQLQSSRACIELCGQLEALGYLCHMGRHRQVLRERKPPDLVIVVGLLSVREKSDSDGPRYALIELGGRWETVDEDRPKIPSQWLVEVPQRRPAGSPSSANAASSTTLGVRQTEVPA